ncbi:MAG: multiheme c-type cytochrome [Candidatus Polarisedimenticolia bacterium]
MRRPAPAAAVALLLAAATATAPAAEPPREPRGPLPLESSCVACHSQLDGPVKEPADRAPEDVHFLKGLGCSDCHGGNPAAGADGDMDAAHDRTKGFAGRPARLGIPAFCARCHADAVFMKRFDPHARVDQLAEYRTSVHGRKNAEKDERAAVCTDCHGVHGIRAVSDPRSSVHPSRVADTCGRCHADPSLMGRYFIPTNQLEEYRTSVHAAALHERGDLSAPTCNDCHGSHGAVPPGVEHVTNVCGSCHSREAGLFRETELKRGLDLTACIQCVVCHGNHAVLKPTPAMLGVGEGSTCTGCHAEGEEEYAAAERMARSAAALTDRLREASELLDRAEQAGVEVGPDRFELQKARDSLVEARVLVHAFDLERYQTATGAGLAVADGGVAAGRRAFTELRHRRAGLLLSLVVIAAVIAGLVIKIRSIEQGSPP